MRVVAFISLLPYALGRGLDAYTYRQGDLLDDLSSHDLSAADFALNSHLNDDQGGWHDQSNNVEDDSLFDTMPGYETNTPRRPTPIVTD